MPFRYLRDPLFVFCVVTYFINRFLIKPHFHTGFFHDSYNDFICIPFWVPIMLWLARKTMMRDNDMPPEWHEIVIPLIVWSYVFELWLPFTKPFHRLSTCDPTDIFWYTMGAPAATLTWRWYYRPRPVGYESVPHLP